jgi:molybdopterin converting factor small subunit
VEVLVKLFPPLNNTAGRSRVAISLEAGGTIHTVIDRLIEQFGPRFRQHFYDDHGRIIPAWSVFVNGQPVQLNRCENLASPVEDGDELTFILNIAGG